MDKSGVYEILNTTNGKRYVGSAVDLPKRKRQHWNSLRRNYHHNQYLQNAWNKHSEVAFVFSTIEYCEPELLVAFEQYWIEMLGPEYNILTVAGSSLGYTHTPESKVLMSELMKGSKQTAESKAKISTTMKGRKQTAEHRANNSATKIGRKLTPEHRAKISAAKMGTKHTPEARAKISAAQKGKPWSPARRAAYEKGKENNHALEEANELASGLAATVDSVMADDER